MISGLRLQTKLYKSNNYNRVKCPRNKFFRTGFEIYVIIVMLQNVVGWATGSGCGQIINLVDSIMAVVTAAFCFVL